MIAIVFILYMLCSVLLLWWMLWASDWDVDDSFFVYNITTWNKKSLFQKSIIIALNLFVIPWLIAFKIALSFKDLFK